MKPDFFMVPTIVKEAKGLRPADWFVYAAIYWFEHMRGQECFASNAAIGVAAGIGARTVSRALENLEKGGFIERQFVDRGKTKRVQIHAKVFFAKTPSLFDDLKKQAKGQQVAECKYCGDTDSQKFVKDHIIPTAKGGTNDPENLQLICASCNNLKGILDENDFADIARKMRSGGPNGRPLNPPKRATTASPGGRQNSNKRQEVDTAAVAAAVKNFNMQETRAKWYAGEDPTFQLLAWFFDKKGLWRRLDSRMKVEAAVNRHIRSARLIVRGEWSQKECDKALAKMLEANPKMREEWTLATLDKYLTK